MVVEEYIKTLAKDRTGLDFNIRPYFEMVHVTGGSANPYGISIANNNYIDGQIMFYGDLFYSEKSNTVVENQRAIVLYYPYERKGNPATQFRPLQEIEAGEPRYRGLFALNQFFYTIKTPAFYTGASFDVSFTGFVLMAQ